MNRADTLHELETPPDDQAAGVFRIASEIWMPPISLGNHNLNELIAAKLTEKTGQAVTESDSGKHIIDIAEKLGRDSHRWEQTKSNPAPKCNQYVEAVMQACHIAVPWKIGQSDCHAIRKTLDRECRKPNSQWEKVYAYDDKHSLASDKLFTKYAPRNGDIMIWDGLWDNEYVQHAGIVAEPYDILYAGSNSPRAPQGWAHGKIWQFTQSAKYYGSPTAVYRYADIRN